MESVEHDGNGAAEALPPPPPVPPNIVPLQAEPEHVPEPVKKKVVRVPTSRRGLGSKGQKIPLLTNHFKVNVTNVDGHFFHYCVSVSYEDGRPVDGKGVGRKVIDRVHETYDTELAGKDFAYDGEKSLFTVGPLPRNKLEFTVVLEDISSNRNNGNRSPGSPNENDRKRQRRPYQSKTFKVEISFAAKIPMQAIANALRGQESENSQEALRVLDIILRQHAAKQGCLLVRQSFFHNDPKNFADVGGGVLGCRGFHSSFRTTQGGLSLNIDVSTTMIIQPGPVVDFLISNQNVKDPFSIDWAKAKRTLKNLRIKTNPANTEYKITGLSERPCKEQTFSLKQRGKDNDGEVETLEVTVYDYFVNYRHIELRYSGDLPCINVGKPKRPTYFPLEALKINNYDAEPMLRSCGISISTNFTQVEGRVLPAPKKLVEPTKIERWAVVNFSARCDTRGLIRDLIRIGEMKGVHIDPPFDVFDESPQNRRAPPPVRVEKMFEDIQSKLPGAPQFLLCLLPDRKNSDLYGPWKRKNLADYGIVNQCMAPMRVNDQYLNNLLLKINAKLGGLNSLLAVEHSPSIPLVSKVPTIIIGMDVSHGSPGQSDIPSIAAVVSSRHWPLISRYRASVRTQSPKVEMIDSLYKRVSDTEDEGIMRELLLDFYLSSGKRKPDQIIIFRDGVSESQFNQVLNIELDQIIEACKFLDEKWSPKFVVIVAQKNHHTKFFQPGSPDNVPPGTVIDNKICHPRNNDFYLPVCTCWNDCFGENAKILYVGRDWDELKYHHVELYTVSFPITEGGLGGTTRPTHYHVLLDEVGFSADELQELVHSLSYVYQRSTTAISVVAPICYAHLAATQVGTFMKFEDMSETSSSHGGLTSAGPVPVPQLPKLAESVCFGIGSLMTQPSLFPPTRHRPPHYLLPQTMVVVCR
ncbi:argonaute family protein [Actinidia rufa]|uniref:Argonaute family protein n=1 Tax=Actinidia rufa TaxID=165716 RepID=A0A7J0GQG1_9ERIC|nr:argonaute family protein [Actinidia rufa]